MIFVEHHEINIGWYNIELSKAKLNPLYQMMLLTSGTILISPIKRENKNP